MWTYVLICVGVNLPPKTGLHSLLELLCLHHGNQILQMHLVTSGVQCAWQATLLSLDLALQAGVKGTCSTANILMSRTGISGPYPLLVFFFWVNGRDEPSHDPGTSCNAYAHVDKLQCKCLSASRSRNREMQGQKVTCQVS